VFRGGNIADVADECGALAIIRVVVFVMAMLRRRTLD